MVVRIGTWNVENLFRPGQDGGPSSLAAYEAKLAALAATIVELAPDVLAVQEVGGSEALADLAERAGGGWHQATADPDRRGIRVGFLSRVALADVVQVRMFPPGLGPVQIADPAPATTHVGGASDGGGAAAAGGGDDGTVREVGRSVLQARVQLGGRVVDVVTCHLKSKLLTFPGSRFAPRDEEERARFAAYALFRRAAEAVTVRAAATALLGQPPTSGDAGGDSAGRSVVVLGDFNDGPEAATTQLLYGPPGSEIGTAGFERPDGGDGQRLWNLAARILEGQRFSRVYRGRGELIDHILVSRALVDTVADGAVTTTGPAPSITDDPAARRNAAGSDHRPVVAEFTL